MTYTRKQIDRLRTQLQAKPILEDLRTKFHNGDSLSLAEEDYLCSMMKIMREGTGQYKYDITKLSGCTNYRFRRMYIQYAHDLNAIGSIQDYFGTVGVRQKQLDVAFLNQEYKSWVTKMTGKKTADAMWNNLLDETAHQNNLLHKFEQRDSPGQARIDYLHKSLILNSRYVYLQVKEFFEYLGKPSIVLHLYGFKVLIDSFSFIHILFRHFAASIKDYQEGKSYHVDESIFYKDLPFFFERFVRCFGKNFPKSAFNGRSMNFVYNGRAYSIWFRSITIACTLYLRLQSFYPIEARNDRLRIQSMKKSKINKRPTFLTEH